METVTTVTREGVSSEGRGETVTTVTREGVSSEGRGETVTTVTGEGMSSEGRGESHHWRRGERIEGCEQTIPQRFSPLSTPAHDRNTQSTYSAFLEATTPSSNGQRPRHLVS